MQDLDCRQASSASGLLWSHAVAWWPQNCFPFHLSDHLRWALVQRSFNLHLWIAQWTMFTNSDFWKRFWACTVMSSRGSCLFLIWRHLRTQRSHYLSPAHRYSSWVSECFDDIMYCRWWDPQSLSNFTLRNRLFHNFKMQFVADCWTSAHPYICLSEMLLSYPVMLPTCWQLT